MGSDQPKESLARTTTQRALVLELRQRAEKAAASIHDAVIRPPEPSGQGRFLAKISCVPFAREMGHGMSERAPRVSVGRLFYRRSSDFLHGRSNQLVVSDAQVAEWKAYVESLESLATGLEASYPPNLGGA